MLTNDFFEVITSIYDEWEPQDDEEWLFDDPTIYKWRISFSRVGNCEAVDKARDQTRACVLFLPLRFHGSELEPSVSSRKPKSLPLERDRVGIWIMPAWLR